VIYGGFNGKNLIKSKNDNNDRDHFKREIATVVGFGYYDIEEINRPIHVPNFQVGKFKIESLRDSKTKTYFDTRYSDIFTAKGLGENNKNVQVCKGDSGGAIYISLQGIRVQIGVTVATDSKCKKGYNEFVSIKNHARWIRRNVKKRGDDVVIIRD